MSILLDEQDLSGMKGVLRTFESMAKHATHDGALGHEAFTSGGPGQPEHAVDDRQAHGQVEAGEEDGVVAVCDILKVTLLAVTGEGGEAICFFRGCQAVENVIKTLWPLPLVVEGGERRRGARLVVAL